MKIDLKAVGVGTAHSARLVTLEGERPLGRPQQDGTTIAVTVPGSHSKV